MENSNQNPNTNNPSSSSFVIKIPSYEEVIQSQSQPPAQSLFKSSQTFTQAFKSIKNSEFYVPPPSSSSQSQPRDNNSTPSAAVNHAGGSSSSTQNRNAILVSNRQKGNPLLKHIRNVRWAFSDIVCDYMLGKNSCALYLSLRYHLLHPDYLYYRIRELGKNFKLRVVLCHVDVKSSDTKTNTPPIGHSNNHENKDHSNNHENKDFMETKINEAVKMVPGDHTTTNNRGMFSSASTSSLSPSRYQPEREYDPQFNTYGQRLMTVSGVQNADIPLNQIVIDTRDQEQDILLLRKHLADFSIKEAKIHNEKLALEKRIAYMRLAFDQQQKDLVDAAYKALSYRQEIIEENIRLTYALQDAQEERTTYIQSLMPLLAEYSLQPPVVDAQSIVSNVKVLFRHLQEKLIGIETKLKESQYQLTAWRSDVNPSSYAPSALHSFGNKNGLELVTQQAYSDGQVPMSSDHLTARGWDVAGHSGGVADNLEPDSGRYSPLMNRNDHSLGTNAQVASHQGNSYPTSKNEEITNKQVTFSDPVSNNDVDDFDEEGNHNEGNEGEPFASWNSRKSSYATTLEDPNSYSPYLSPVLEEPGSSFSEAADDDPLPAVEQLQISGEPLPGRELQASGYSINGTTSCNFEWVRHMEDGSVSYIEGAKQPTYLVTADDVDTYLAIEVQPMDNRKRKGELVKVFANEHRKIVCDPDMHGHIRKALQTGYAEHRLSLWTGYLDIWEPVTLVIKKDGINIKGGGTPVNEKFSPTATVFIPYGNLVEFSIIGLGSAERKLRVEQESATAIGSRDIIVLTLRYFIKRAVEKKKAKKKGLFF